jgi:hypothetical protein
MENMEILFIRHWSRSRPGPFMRNYMTVASVGTLMLVLWLALTPGPPFQEARPAIGATVHGTTQTK